jgi:hypothetical protein
VELRTPELTRNPGVDSIVLMRGDERPSTSLSDAQDYEFDGPSQTIWRRGDEPLGFPADEHFAYSRPRWPLNM